MVYPVLCDNQEWVGDMNKRTDIVYQLTRMGKGWNCRVSWSAAVGYGKTPMLAMQDWQKQHNRLIAKGNKPLR